MKIRDRAQRHAADERGQSLVEVALALPILLLIVIGIVDIGRVYAHAIATESAAREAALYAARTPAATAEQICQRARDEVGAGSAALPCATSPLTIDCERGGAPCTSDTGVLWQTPGSGDVRVTVTYRLALLTGVLVGRGFGNSPVAISGSAAFTGLGE